MGSFYEILCALSLYLILLDVKVESNCPEISEAQKLCCFKEYSCINAGHYYCAELQLCFTYVFHPKPYNEAVEKCSSLNDENLTFGIHEHFTEERAGYYKCLTNAISAYAVASNKTLWELKYESNCYSAMFELEGVDNDEIKGYYLLQEDNKYVFTCDDKFPFYCTAQL